MKTWMGIILVAAWAGALADEVKILEIENVHRRQFEEYTLEAKKTVKLNIKAAGAADRYGDVMIAKGWILDSRSRAVVWELTPDNSSRRSSRYLREIEESIQLKPGHYEVYYAVSPGGSFQTRVNDLGDVLVEIFGSEKRNRNYDRYSRDWGMTLSVDEGDKNDVIVGKGGFPEPDPTAIMQFIGVGDGEYLEKGFTLTKDTEVRVYCLGEGDNGEMYDYGWITDVKSGEIFWQMTYRRSDWAGGAEKNRLADTHISLPKGDYMVTYVTDGSHSYDEWNMMPPRDPRYWGITLWSTDQHFDVGKSVKRYEPKKAENLIVDLTRVGNNQYEEQGFTLTRPASLHIRCLGEMSGRSFADYGWIIEAKSRETVWEMTRRNTRHAGGGSKNRMFDGVVRFEPGDYIAYYITDDSHAYRQWNTGAPYDARAWGLAIWGHTEDFDAKAVKPFNEEKNGDVLVSLIRARDGERLRDRFTLKEPTRVRIYCLGEGTDDEMHDYGWIEDEDGRTVWRMEYWDTEHAGGGSKNRMINEVISLKAGEYRVYYKTDGSHAFESWNTDPPRDPKYWGITIRKEGK